MHSVKSLTLRGLDIPEQIRSVPDAPKSLFYRGNLSTTELANRPIVAIVGSRKVDSYGEYTTKLLARKLAERGVIIISGLALGTDAIAHSACLSTGTPSIAVLASGIENLTPRTNFHIATQILKNGAILSEHEGDYSPFKHDFLIRNRLISGLSLGVIIPQASARSGSLNTARHALEQGRTVMAVPGPITNPLCEGPNNLLKMGATPVTCAEDVLKTLNIHIDEEPRKDYDLLAENHAELAIIKQLLAGVSDGEELAIKTGMSAQEFNAHLTMLEIRGIIRPLGANKWTLT